MLKLNYHSLTAGEENKPVFGSQSPRFLNLNSNRFNPGPTHYTTSKRPNTSWSVPSKRVGFAAASPRFSSNMMFKKDSGLAPSHYNVGKFKRKGRARKKSSNSRAGTTFSTSPRSPRDTRSENPGPGFYNPVHPLYTTDAQRVEMQQRRYNAYHRNGDNDGRYTPRGQAANQKAGARQHQRGSMTSRTSRELKRKEQKYSESPPKGKTNSSILSSSSPSSSSSSSSSTSSTSFNHNRTTTSGNHESNKIKERKDVRFVQWKKAPRPPTHDFRSSMFKCSTHRSSLVAGDNKGPGPGAYNIRFNRRKKQDDSGEIMSREHLTSSFKPHRKGRFYDWTGSSTESIHSELTGPGSYDPRPFSVSNITAFKSKSSRQLFHDDDSPGPCYYYAAWDAWCA